MAPHKFKRALRSAARLPSQLLPSRSASSRSNTAIFEPQPNELPLVLLRIQVLGCTALVSKDPFVSVSLLHHRHQTPVAKRTGNPKYAPGDATWDFALYVSLADRLGAVELVVWDKHLVGKGYLGEVAIPLDEWWGEEGRAFGWDDVGNKPFRVDLESTRTGTVVSGTVEVKLGFVKPPQAQTQLEFGAIFEELTEGVGTIRSHQDPGRPQLDSVHLRFQQLEDDGGISSDDDSDADAEDDPEDPSVSSPLLDLYTPLRPSQSPSASIAPVLPSTTSALTATPPASPSFADMIFQIPVSIPWNIFGLSSSSSTVSAPSIVPVVPSSSEDGTLPPLPNEGENKVLLTNNKEQSTPVINAGVEVLQVPVLDTAGVAQKKKKRSAGKGYRFDPGKDILGIVMLEVLRAENLPKLDNLLHTGWDVDPFVVVSFSKKVFRTRVVRHALNPAFEEKLLFRVRRYETGFGVRFGVWDWDKVGGNEWVGVARFKVQELIGRAPQPDAETGMYPQEADGEHDMVEFTLPLDTSKAAALVSEVKHRPVLYVRAKYQPYALLRQRFWRLYLAQYDTDHTGAISRLELGTMLDSLGTTLSRETVDGFFKVVGKGGEIGVEDAVRCLEREIGRGRGIGGTGESADGEADRERVINVTTCPLCHRARLGSKAEVDIVTHLAVCASRDWKRVGGIMMGDFVTVNEAQRGWFERLLVKIGGGEYRVGADSANVIVQNRATGQLEEEKMQVYVRLGIRLLYKGATSQMEGPRARHLLKFLSVRQGVQYDSPHSALDIPGFIDFHGLNVDEILEPLDSFKTFNEFFYRKLKPTARPLSQPTNPSRLVSAADCRLLCFSSVDEATRLWIKGRAFTVARLLGGYAGEAGRYAGGGAVAICRLAPQDYHRFHAPVDGRVGAVVDVEGEYYTVNPQAIRSVIDVYGENVRKVVPIESLQFGKVMVVCVGAMMVGSIKMTVEEGEYVKRGQEIGYFAFGGSTVVVLFEKGKVEWDEDLLVNGRASLETLVRVGVGIGKAVT